MAKKTWVHNKQSQQQINKKADFLSKYENQFDMLKTFFRNEWWQWDEEKRKEEIREWMVKAWYIANERQK